MITNSREENLPSKLEAEAAATSVVDHHDKLGSKAAASSSSSAAAGVGATATSWLRLKDPRIVRVSRAFGGKDRHSKVCTMRGLRDRRVRLSVSTAIQLYDLQDRLGLNQPSKVVDWLLNAAKDEIDELPPLPISSASLGLNNQSLLPSHTTHLHRSEFKINCNNGNIVDQEARDEGEEKQDKNNNNSSHHPSSFSALLNNVAAAPFGYHWEPSNLPSSHHMGSHGFENLHNFNNVNLSLPSPLSLSTGSHIYVSPSGIGLTQSLENIDPRQINHLQMLSSSSQSFLLNNSLTHPNPLHSINQQPIRPFHFSMAPKFLSQDNKNNNNNGDQANKDDEFGSDD